MVVLKSHLTPRLPHLVKDQPMCRKNVSIIAPTKGITTRFRSPDSIDGLGFTPNSFMANSRNSLSPAKQYLHQSNGNKKSILIILIILLGHIRHIRGVCKKWKQALKLVKGSVTMATMQSNMLWYFSFAVLHSNVLCNGQVFKHELPRESNYPKHI